MRVSFSTESVPTHEREPVWRELITKRLFSVTAIDRPDPATTRARLTAEIAGPFTLVEVETACKHLHRTQADVARDGGGKFALVRIPVDTYTSTALTHVRRQESRLAPGDFVVSSTEWLFDTQSSSGACAAMLLIPHERLAPLLAGGRMTGPSVVEAASPLAALLGAGFAAAMTQLPNLSPELGDPVLQNLCNLAALACGASEAARASAEPSMRELRLAEARRFVDDHLTDPGLTPAAAAAALGISVRQLHLRFEPTGESFARYVMRRRLEACRAALANPAQARRSVLDIAFGWGFDNLSTFYRAFRGAFGVAPGELRAATLHGAA